ncbi:hypothetical protein OS493_013948 [Desmophyllum pertusum]|uniref:Uncharacterized protein n=1 Tax=Desmophyllum pertusum TaxID=174260 RepID=A0A9X0CXG4_9CNID|nr:hypothetical protein OS493_013948 [Desmophyllum pertusum]
MNGKVWIACFSMINMYNTKISCAKHLNLFVIDKFIEQIHIFPSPALNGCVKPSNSVQIVMINARDTVPAWTFKIPASLLMRKVRVRLGFFYVCQFRIKLTKQYRKINSLTKRRVHSTAINKLRVEYQVNITQE